MDGLNPRKYVGSRLAETEPAWRFQPGATPTERRRWQDALRRRIRAALGGLPYQRVPPQLRMDDAETVAGCTRRRIVFDTRPGLSASGFLLVPTEMRRPLPGVVCLPGHGSGVRNLVGLGVEGEYQRNFGLQCARRGCVVLALEQISFGERADDQAKAVGPEQSSCVRDSMAALMLGESMGGWRVWDAMRAIDVLQSLPEVVASRIGVMGISGGGMTAFWTAALDRRVRAAVVSGYFNFFDRSVLAVDHCVDNFVPGIRNLVEMPDMAALIAPRALFVENGINDPIFPVTAFREAVARAEAIYADFDAVDRFGSEVFSDGHVFHGVGAFDFLARQL